MIRHHLLTTSSLILLLTAGGVVPTAAIARIPTPVPCVTPPCGSATDRQQIVQAFDDATATPSLELSPTPTATPDPAALPPQADALEDNYDAAHAAPIALDTLYDLNFVCPVTWPGACEGGDHDYVRVPLKANTAYLIATYNISGTDTVLELYWEQHTQPLLSNDDYYGQDLDRGIAGGVASALHVRPPADGWATLRISPRFGAHAAATTPGTYTLAVAVEGSELARTIARTLAEQAGISPTPTAVPATPPPDTADRPDDGADTPAPTPAPAPPPPAPAAPAPSSAAPRATPTMPITTGVAGGTAVVTRDSPLTVAPGGGEVLQTVPEGTQVALTGHQSGVWVEVTLNEGIVPGWIDSRVLTRLADEPTATSATADAATPAATTRSGRPGGPVTMVPDGETAQASGAARPAPAASRGQALRVTVQGAVPLPTLIASPPTARVIVVTVCTERTGASGCPPNRAAGDVRIELLHGATRALLQGGRTEASGQLRLATSVTPTTSVLLHLPTYGVLVPLPTAPTITIQLPTGGRV